MLHRGTINTAMWNVSSEDQSRNREAREEAIRIIQVTDNCEPEGVKVEGAKRG